MTDQTCCGACGYPVHATKESACDWCRQSANRIEALETKLAKAVEALEFYTGYDDDGSIARATLGAVSETHKIKGKSHD